MRTIAAFLLATNVLQLLFVLRIGELLDGRGSAMHPFTLPHLWTLLAVTGLLAILTLRRNSSTPLVLITAAGLLATLATAIYAIQRWPGGDDGGGMGWIVYEGGLSLLNVIAALVLAFLALTRPRYKRMQ